MAFRGFNMAAPGSLIKGAVKKGKVAPTAEGQRKPRVHDGGHLAFIRKLPCLSCGVAPAGEAAHLRMASAKHSKPNAGIGNKPDDRWTLPLCHWCHVEGPEAQHRVGERPFWDRLAMNPFRICEEIFASEGNEEIAEGVIIYAKGGAYPPDWE